MIIRFLFLLIMLCFTLKGFCITSADSLMRILKTEVSRKERYDNRMELKINELRNAYLHTPAHKLNTRYNLVLALYESFKDYHFDSSYKYVRKLISLSTQLNDRKKLTENRLRLGMTLISSGMFKETFDCLRETDQGYLDDVTRKSYYILYSWAYSDLANYNADRVYSPVNLKKKYLYLDSAIALTVPGTFERLILEAQRKPGKGSDPSAYLLELMKRKLSLHEEAMVATGLSGYRSGPEKISLLATAAINDIRTSTYRALAMLELGTALYAQGNIEDAYFCLQQALYQGNKFGGRLQRYQAARRLSEVAAARDRITEQDRQRFVIYMICVIMLTAISCLIGFIIFVQLKKVRAAERIIRKQNNTLAGKNQRLWEEGKIKEEYIGYFLSEVSRYISKLDKLKRNTQRKAKSGSIQELLRLLDEIDIASERTEFFHTFDRIFLKLFPDFANAVNSMFNEKDRIIPKSPASLTPQLRIFALMRLGIDKNEAIAAMLQYTVNTVYTYRFRARSKAIVSGDEFEKFVKGIQLTTHKMA